MVLNYGRKQIPFSRNRMKSGCTTHFLALESLQPPALHGAPVTLTAVAARSPGFMLAFSSSLVRLDYWTPNGFVLDFTPC